MLLLRGKISFIFSKNEASILSRCTRSSFSLKFQNSSVMFPNVIFLLHFVLKSITGVCSFEAEVTFNDIGPFGYSLQLSSQMINSERIVSSTDVNVENDVYFHLFTNANSEVPHLLKIGDLNNLMESHFDSESPTKVIVHGWTDSVDTHWYNNFRNNYLAVGNCNVILVDWSSGAAKEYFTSSKLTRPVGEYVGKLLQFLVDSGNMSLSNLHILGHSLGAHIAGIAGSSLSGRIGRITGMDPASPAFEVPFLVDIEDRLDPTDARFVDVIHTCSGSVGFTSTLGHVDFYPNGGTFVQPGCPPIMSQFCSHARSHQFMSESIVRPEAFLSLRCENWTEFVTGRCNADVDAAYMGEMVDEKTRGSFYLITNPRQPFGRSS